MERAAQREGCVAGRETAKHARLHRADRGSGGGNGEAGGEDSGRRTQLTGRGSHNGGPPNDENRGGEGAKKDEKGRRGGRKEGKGGEGGKKGAGGRPGAPPAPQGRPRAAPARLTTPAPPPPRRWGRGRACPLPAPRAAGRGAPCRAAGRGTAGRHRRDPRRPGEPPPSRGAPVPVPPTDLGRAPPPPPLPTSGRAVASGPAAFCLLSRPVARPAELPHLRLLTPPGRGLAPLLQQRPREELPLLLQNAGAANRSPSPGRSPGHSVGRTGWTQEPWLLNKGSSPRR